jgi:hypothetical protein
MAEGAAVILFYQEEDGGFLAIDTATNAYYRQVPAQDHFQGRAAAIASLVGSVCTTGISREYLRANCKRVARARVPADWLRAIGL